MSEGILLQAVETTEDGTRRVWAMVIVPNGPTGLRPLRERDFRRVLPRARTLGVPTDAKTLERFCDYFQIVDNSEFYTDHDQEVKSNAS